MTRIPALSDLQTEKPRNLTAEEVATVQSCIEQIVSIFNRAEQPMLFTAQLRSKPELQVCEYYVLPEKHNFDFLDFVKDLLERYSERCPKLHWPDGTRFRRMHAVELARKIDLPSINFGEHPTEESLQIVRKIIKAFPEADKNKHTVGLKIKDEPQLPISKSSDGSFVNDIGKGTTPGMRYA